jgi:hypothetical protein
MATITPDKYTVIQAYGGVKAVYFECNTASAADVIDFSGKEVTDIVMCVLQADDDGAAVPYTVTGTDDSEVTIGAGPSAEKVKGILYFQAR